MIINKRLYSVVDTFELIDENQAGFCSGLSVIDNLFVLQSMVQKYIGKPRGRFYVLYVDFHKAFDSIDHEVLFKVLSKRGIGGKVLRILRSMYSNLKACLRVGNKITEAFTCNIVTRQGDITSPIIFNLFIQNLSTFLSENYPGVFISNVISPIQCILYADNIAHCADTVRNLQIQINKLSEFCNEFKLSINMSKTEVIVFRNGGPLRTNEKWYFNGNLIKITNMYKYMGLLFTPKLAWTSAKYKLVAQARKAIYSIKSYQHAFGFFPCNEYFKIFDAVIVPILTFGAEIWGTEYTSIIENLHFKYCREFLGVNQSTNSSVVLAECGRLPLCVFYKLKVIKYWIKLLHMVNTRYPKQCYLMLKGYDEIGRTNWVMKVRELLQSYGFGVVWLSQELGDHELFCKIFKQRISDCSLQFMQESINSSSRCDLYKNIHSLLDPERYLFVDMSPHLRRYVARFRCWSHKLNIALGRHINVFGAD